MKSTRKMWSQKLLAGKLSSPKANGITSRLVKSAFTGVILGVDPSLRGTGLAVLYVDKPRGEPVLLESVTVKCHKDLPFEKCLAEIHLETMRLVKKHFVTCASIEQTIYVQNVKVSAIMGSARGACLSALGISDVPIFEYPPLRIKQATIGFGRASKEQIAKSIKGFLKLETALPFDESDAAAAAITHIVS